MIQSEVINRSPIKCLKLFFFDRNTFHLVNKVNLQNFLVILQAVFTVRITISTFKYLQIMKIQN